MSLADHIVPMSELRSDPDKIKKLLKTSPVVITNKGRPDFGICDLDTLEIATSIQKLKCLLIQRGKDPENSMDIHDAFAMLKKKHGF